MEQTRQPGIHTIKDKKMRKSKTEHPNVPVPVPEPVFPIVGIGASAGGLAAFEAFFSGMPLEVEPGMAFVLVQHLAPDHKSILTDLIKRYTRMQVYEVTDGMRVQVNCAYIIPPNRDMAFINGSLQLLEQASPRGLRLPIDFFFRSLAQDQRERAIGIVLSGTGSDGSLGVRAIKGENGLVLAQDPATTEYNSMPLSAIATGSVDAILPPAQMAAQLIYYSGRSAADSSVRLNLPPLSKHEDLYQKIFVLLRASTGHNFSYYKPQTITRRVERRMAVNQVNRLEDYLRYLQQTPAEVDTLFHDLLIGVTNFFRDPPVFETMEQIIIPGLVASRPAGETLRVWVPGCSTGEEAYSLAILFQEHQAAFKQGFRLQVFATDIDSQAIERARTGIFPANIALDITPERLARYFGLQPGGGYRIQKAIRDLLVFSEHDLIKDPPFSRMDLISCRNVLIYMGSELHKKLIPLFHYALNPGGSLLLGTSESIGDFVDLFSTQDRKAKVYQRKQAVYNHGQPVFEKFMSPSREAASATLPAIQSQAKLAVSLRDLTERLLLQKYTPTGLLVNEQGEILYLHGRSGHYLEPASGEPAGLTNILKLAREGLRPALASALHKAAASRELVTQNDLRVKTNGDYSTVNLSVLPVSTSSNLAGSPGSLFLVVLEKAPQPAQTGAAPAGLASPVDLDERIVSMQRELREKDEFIQHNNEELDTIYEELKSSNEEMQSVNEELQSTNEELETAKEELQSVNEELSTVNVELQQRVQDLSRANNDMSNLMASTGVGTIFVNYKLLIQRFTTYITPVFNLIPSDVGRPVADITSNLEGYDRLLQDVQAVLDTLIPKEVEVITRQGVWYLLRIQPYRTLENVIEGATINFTNISELKKVQSLRRESEGLERLATVVRDANDAILVQDLTGRILAWNPMAEKIYGRSEGEALAMNIRDLVPADDRKQALGVVHQLTRGRVLEPYRITRLTRNNQVVEVWITATALLDANGDTYAIATTERAASAP